MREKRGTTSASNTTTCRSPGRMACLVKGKETSMTAACAKRRKEGNGQTSPGCSVPQSLRRRNQQQQLQCLAPSCLKSSVKRAQGQHTNTLPPSDPRRWVFFNRLSNWEAKSCKQNSHTLIPQVLLLIVNQTYHTANKQ